ncbi:hypothetical protein I6F10_04980 [Pseudoalteromonas sp. SWYJZ98]|uniref:hypothetical protein n=1 Tax=Pseudoalteromonas sp. SWYJZ98 TaxID=2792060 RepID=UPI0018CCEA02|nr:hypothetical protein [Pseudoalteromonas sp. SWYJZ98]MBH0030266.1 hypothetical protein [Pseudoalteromonas sp. SWYJZ98]
MKFIKFNSSIFTYPIFLGFVGVPIIIATLLMWLIACSSNLSFAFITKESLELFVEYQKIPLFILSLALPLGTVAAANFRALQFNSNLERQEYEHQLDLFYKGEEQFVKIMYGVIQTGNYKHFDHAFSSLIYSRLYKKPSKGELYDANPMKKRLDKVCDTFNVITETLDRLSGYSDNDSSEYKEALLLHYNDLNGLQKHVGMAALCCDMKLILLIKSIDDAKGDLSNAIGIPTLGANASISKYIDSIIEMSKVINSIVGLHLKVREDNFDMSMFKKTVERWLDNSYRYSNTVTLSDLEKKYNLTPR